MIHLEEQFIFKTNNGYLGVDREFFDTVKDYVAHTNTKLVSPEVFEVIRTQLLPQYEFQKAINKKINYLIENP